MTSDPTTWAALKATLANWTNRDDLSTTEIPEAIALAERRLNRILRVPDMEAIASATVSASTITLPSDFLEMRAAYLSTDPKAVLEAMNLADLRNTYAATTTGKPQNYAVQASQMVFGPSPDTSYTIVMNYYALIPALGSGQATNWLLTAHPDIYLNASMAELNMLMMDDARADRYEARLSLLLEELRQQSQRKARGAGPVRIRSPFVV